MLASLTNNFPTEAPGHDQTEHALPLPHGTSQRRRVADVRFRHDIVARFVDGAAVVCRLSSSQIKCVMSTFVALAVVS